MANKYKTLAAKLEDATAKYHELSQSDAPSQKELRKLHEQIKMHRQALSDHIAEGAKADKDSQLVGTRVRAGVWQILDLTTGKRSRGEDRDEAVENWNAGTYYEADAAANPVGTAAE